MKKIIILFYFILSVITINAQVQGNANIRTSGNANISHPKTFVPNDLQPRLSSNNHNQLIINVRGLYNEKETRQVAYFSLTQLGQDIKGVNQLMDERIKNVEQKIKAMHPSMEFYVDLISFIPIYDLELEKKVFNKRTYNETPKGFELKKNIHISFEKVEWLEEIMAICAENEIYDLIKVDYISKDFHAIQKRLKNKANEVYKETLKFHEEIHGKDFSKKKKYMNDGFATTYPKDRYQSYTAFSSTSLPPKKRTTVRKVRKSTTSYYEAIEANNHDFVLNPEILDPVIQTVYELQVVIDLREPLPEKKPDSNPKTITKNQYFMVTPDGKVVALPE